ncbi:MAG: hypothetical protein LWW77_12100 [Propionibacteriales bacterium]|nr:hypothetical protein [Propionibacteriales bacterium]
MGWAQGEATAPVSGIVLLDDKPVAGVKVCDLSDSDGVRCAVSAEDGSFIVDVAAMPMYGSCLSAAPVTPAQQALFAGVGWATRGSGCQVNVNPVGTTEVHLESYRIDTGRVVNAAGKPLAGVTVDGGAHNKTVTDAKGRFTTRIEVHGYDDGRLLISAPGYQTAYAYSILGGDSLGTIALAKKSATPRFSVTGRVTNAKGAPVARAEVCVIEGGACVKTNAKGEYISLPTSPDATSGAWAFQVFAPNGHSWVEADVRAPWKSNFTRADFRLPAMVSAKPVITGEAKVGSQLVADAGTWTPTPSKLTYRWYANGKKIAGAKSSTLVLKKAQKGKRITVKVTGTKKGYPTVTRVSAPTKKVKR